MDESDKLVSSDSSFGEVLVEIGVELEMCRFLVVLEWSGRSGMRWSVIVWLGKQVRELVGLSWSVQKEQKCFWSVSDGGILVGFYWKQILVALKELVGQVEQNLVGLDGVDPKLVGPKEVESIQSCKEVESIQSCMEAGRSGAMPVGFDWSFWSNSGRF